MAFRIEKFLTDSAETSEMRELYVTTIWDTPCRFPFHQFQKKDLIGAPDPTQPGQLRAKNAQIQVIKKIVTGFFEATITAFFPDAKGMPQKFKDETKFYRLNFLPIVPIPSKDYFGNALKGNRKKAMAQAFTFMKLYASALHLISLDNMLYPNATSEKAYDVEREHSLLTCELEMTMAAFGESPPQDAAARAGQLKLIHNPVELMRHMRQYLVTRDYLKLLEFVSFMYRYFAKDSTLPDH